jgi:hypothetical protein
MNTNHRNRPFARSVLAGALSLSLAALAATASAQSAGQVSGGNASGQTQSTTDGAIRDGLEGSEATALGQTGRDTAQGTTTQNENTRRHVGGSTAAGVSGEEDIHDASDVVGAQPAATHSTGTAADQQRQQEGTKGSATGAGTYGQTQQQTRNEDRATRDLMEMGRADREEAGLTTGSATRESDDAAARAAHGSSAVGPARQTGSSATGASSGMRDGSSAGSATGGMTEGMSSQSVSGGQGNANQGTSTWDDATTRSGRPPGTGTQDTQQGNQADDSDTDIDPPATP